MLKTEAKEFWDAPDFKRQQELIAGAVPWETSVQNAALHRTWIETPMVRDYLTSLPSRPVVVELGCGVGRILKEFMKDYPLCIGLDISRNMLTKAAEYLGSEGQYSLGAIAEGHLPLFNKGASFLYSFLVFQHIQTKAEIAKYMSEIERVLVPGGFFRVQTLKGQPHSEDKFGGFHGRFYPSMDVFSRELKSMTTNMDIMEMEEGLGHPDWLWVTMRKS